MALNTNTQWRSPGRHRQQQNGAQRRHQRCSEKRILTRSQRSTSEVESAPRDLCSRRPVPVWLVYQPADHTVARHLLSTALATQRIRLDNPALDRRPVQLESLPDSAQTDSAQTEFVEAAERGQEGYREGSVEHFEVFRTDVQELPSRKSSTPI